MIGGHYASVSFTPTVGLLLKTNSTGLVQFRKEFDSAEIGQKAPVLITSIAKTQDGGYLVSADVNGDQHSKLIVRTDGFCNQVWKKLIFTPSSYLMQWSISVELTTCGFFIAGETDTAPDGIPTLWAKAIDVDGNITFSQENITSQVSPQSLSIINVDTSYLIFYEKATNQYNNNYITKMMRLGKNGDLQLDTQVTFLGGTSGNTIIKATSDGNLLLVFGFPSLQKIDREGKVIWGKHCLPGVPGDNSRDNYLSDVIEVSTGGFMVVGWTRMNGNDDVLLYKINADGDSLWTHQYGGNNDDVGKAIVETPDGGFVIAAETHSYGGGGSDIWLLKVDANGKLQTL